MHAGSPVPVCIQAVIWYKLWGMTPPHTDALLGLVRVFSEARHG